MDVPITPNARDARCFKCGKLVGFRSVRGKTTCRPCGDEVAHKEHQEQLKKAQRKIELGQREDKRLNNTKDNVLHCADCGAETFQLYVTHENNKVCRGCLDKADERKPKTNPYEEENKRRLKHIPKTALEEAPKGEDKTQKPDIDMREYQQKQQPPAQQKYTCNDCQANTSQAFKLNGLCYCAACYGPAQSKANEARAERPKIELTREEKEMLQAMIDNPPPILKEGEPEPMPVKEPKADKAEPEVESKAEKVEMMDKEAVKPTTETKAANPKTKAPKAATKGNRGRPKGSRNKTKK